MQTTARPSKDCAAKRPAGSAATLPQLSQRQRRLWQRQRQRRRLRQY